MDKWEKVNEKLRKQRGGISMSSLATLILFASKVATFNPDISWLVVIAPWFVGKLLVLLSAILEVNEEDLNKKQEK